MEHTLNAQRTTSLVHSATPVPSAAKSASLSLRQAAHRHELGFEVLGEPFGAALVPIPLCFQPPNGASGGRDKNSIVRRSSLEDLE
jgi:hypothetical protein